MSAISLLPTPHKFAEAMRYVLLGIIMLDSVLLFEGFAYMRTISTYARNIQVEYKLLSDIKDVECGQRGYLYTGRDEYLPQYYAGIEQVRVDMQNLRQYINYPSAQLLIKQLDDDVDNKLTEMAKTIELAKKGHPDQARDLVDSDQGLALMERIKVAMGALHAQEQDRLRYHGLMERL